MSEIPEHIWEAARALRGAVLWESNSSVEHIAQALLAAEKRGKEEAAKIAEADGRRELSWAEMSLPVSPGPIIAKDRANVATRIAAAIRGS